MRKRTSGRLIILIIVVYVLIPLLVPPPAAAGDPSEGHFFGKKIIYIDSYHGGYEWSDGIERGIRSILRGSGAELKIFRMDTKRNTSEAYRKQSALRARAFIQKERPDLIIASDDNASRYLIMPYFRDSDLPVVFCGTNWDASKYGYPYRNATGMVEVDTIDEMITLFDKFTKGKRYGYLSGTSDTDRLIAAAWNKRFFQGRMKTYFATSMTEFKHLFIKAQQEVDRLMINNNVGMTDWDQEEAERFILENVKIPSSTTGHWLAGMTLFATAKLPDELGAWSAETALKILGGTQPSSIPVTENKIAVLTVNMSIADRLGIFFSLKDLQRARIIRRDHEVQ